MLRSSPASTTRFSRNHSTRASARSHSVVPDWTFSPTCTHRFQFQEYLYDLLKFALGLLLAYYRHLYLYFTFLSYFGVADICFEYFISFLRLDLKVISRRFTTHDTMTLRCHSLARTYTWSANLQLLWSGEAKLSVFHCFQHLFYLFRWQLSFQQGEEET